MGPQRKMWRIEQKCEWRARGYGVRMKGRGLLKRKEGLMCTGEWGIGWEEMRLEKQAGHE